MATLSSLRTQVWNWLDDPNGSYYTQSQVNTWLNNAQREVQRRLLKAGENYYENVVETNTVANYDSYSLPSDFLWLHRLEVVVSGTGVNEARQDLIPVTLVQLNQDTPNIGLPAAYIIRNNCLVLSPIPDSAYTLRMTYAPKVSDMVNDSDVPSVPDTFTELVAILAVFDGYIKDKTQPSDVLVSKYKEYMTSIEQAMMNRQRQRPRMVVQLDDYFNSGGGGTIF